MKIIKVIGIIALFVFIAAYIGGKSVEWFISSGDTKDKIQRILGYVATGALEIAGVCAGIYLFS